MTREVGRAEEEVASGTRGRGGDGVGVVDVARGSKMTREGRRGGGGGGVVARAGWLAMG